MDKVALLEMKTGDVIVSTTNIENDTTIIKTYGGWIYTFLDSQITIRSSVFVPQELNCNVKTIS